MTDKRYEAWVNCYEARTGCLHETWGEANANAARDRIAIRHVVELRDGERIVDENAKPCGETVEEVRARNRELVRQLRARDFAQSSTRERFSSVSDTLKQERDAWMRHATERGARIAELEQQKDAYDEELTRKSIRIKELEDRCEQMDQQRNSAYRVADNRQREIDVLWGEVERLKQFADAVTSAIYVTGADDPIAYLPATRWHRLQSMLEGGDQ